MHVKVNTKARSRNQLPWKSNNCTDSECVYSLSYPAYKAHAPYYIIVMWPV